MNTSVALFRQRWKVISLAIFFVVIFSYFTIYHAQLFLAYLKVAIWPSIFLLFLGIYREEIRALLRNIKEFKIFGNNVTIGTEESQNLAVEGANAVAQKANDSINELPSMSEISTHSNTDSDATLKRETVERIMRSSAEWGHNMAVLGFRTTPIPQITWKDDGMPQIQFGVGSGQLVLSPHDQADRDILIKEILKIRLEMKSLTVFDRISTGMGGPTKEAALKAVLKDLDTGLRRLDPSSAFLPNSEDT